MRLFLNGRQIAKVAPFFRTSQGWLLLHRQTTPKTSRLPASQQLAAFASSISAGNSRQPKLDEGSGEGPMEEKDGGNSAETEGKRLSAFLDKLCGQRAPPNRDPSAADAFEARMSLEEEVHEFLNGLELDPAKTEGVPEALCQFNERLPGMQLRELLLVMSHFAKQNIRHMELLDRIAEEILGIKETMNPTQLSQLSFCVSRLTYTNPVLLGRIKTDLLEFLKHKETHWEQVVLVVSYFGKLRVGDEDFWAECLRWMDKNYRPVYGHRISTSMALYGCASTNVDRELVVPLVEKVVRQTDIKNYRSPRAWLSFVHTNAMLDTLSASLAESVLQAEFRRALKDEQRAARVSRQTVTYDHLRLMNVANATRYDLGPTRYKGPIPETREISEEIVTVIRRLKYSEIQPPQLEEFLAMLHLIAPLGRLSSPPEWLMNIAVVEGRLFVDAQRSELVPISSIATERKTLPEGVKELAVLFFLAGHTTRVTADDGGRSAPRLDGLYAMQLRHLRLAAPAIRPVVFTETELTAQQDLLEDQQVRMAFIKERLFSAAAAAGEKNGEKLEGPTKKEESSD